MSRMLAFSCLLFSLVAFVPTESLGQDKKKGKSESTPATPQDYKQLAQLKEVQGKLAAAEASAKTLSLRLDYTHYDENPDFNPTAANQSLYNQIQSLLRQQARLANTVNPITRQQRLANITRQLQRLQAQAAGLGANGPLKVVTDHKDFELDVDNKVVVRRAQLPQVYDDKGNLKVYTKAEIAALRGNDSSKPGYAAKYEDLQAGQAVKLTLAPPKKTAESRKDTKDDLLANVPRPRVTMIVILQDESSMSDSADSSRKKKN